MAERASDAAPRLLRPRGAPRVVYSTVGVDFTPREVHLLTLPRGAAAQRYTPPVKDETAHIIEWLSQYNATGSAAEHSMMRSNRARLVDMISDRQRGSSLLALLIYRHTLAVERRVFNRLAVASGVAGLRTERERRQRSLKTLAFRRWRKAVHLESLSRCFQAWFNWHLRMKTREEFMAARMRQFERLQRLRLFMERWRLLTVEHRLGDSPAEPEMQGSSEFVTEGAGIDEAALAPEASPAFPSPEERTAVSPPAGSPREATAGPPPGALDASSVRFAPIAAPRPPPLRADDAFDASRSAEFFALSFRSPPVLSLADSTVGSSALGTSVSPLQGSGPAFVFSPDGVERVTPNASVSLSYSPTSATGRGVSLSGAGPP